MTYEGERVSGDGSTTLPHGGRVPTWTWQAVQDRMAEAMRHWWRSHDSEARFNLGGRISSVWQQTFPDRCRPGADRTAGHGSRRPQAAAAVARRHGADGRSVGMAAPMSAKPTAAWSCWCWSISRGEKKVPWLKLKRRWAWRHGADGLRKRYSRAITDVANVLNGGKPRR
jgi:hypothetical protein